MPRWFTYNTVAGTGSVQSLSSAVLAGTAGTQGSMERVRIYVETAPIRFTLNGTDPVAATTGEVAEVGSRIELFGQETVEFEFINETGLASSLKIHGGRGEGRLP